jgi:hypothetical protein
MPKLTARGRAHDGDESEWRRSRCIRWARDERSAALLNLEREKRAERTGCDPGNERKAAGLGFEGD